jgi:hypothetical protein
MTVTREDIAQMRLEAEMCDDYSVYRREMRQIQRLEAELNRREGIVPAAPKATSQPVKKRPRKGTIRCNSIEEALPVMDRVFGLKKDNREAAA